MPLLILFGVSFGGGVEVFRLLFHNTVNEAKIENDEEQGLGQRWTAADCQHHGSQHGEEMKKQRTKKRE